MRHVLKNRVRSTVIVTLKSGVSFRGVLFDHDSQAVTLRNVEHIGQGTDRSMVVDGELLVLMADVAYLQLPG